MKFLAEDLIEGVHKTVEEEIVDQRRWVTVFRRVFEDNGKFYITFFERGSTEYQESEPYECDKDADGYVECKEVFPVEKTIIVYE